MRKHDEYEKKDKKKLDSERHVPIGLFVFAWTDYGLRFIKLMIEFG
jgi:hypothetical protein